MKSTKIILFGSTGLVGSKITEFLSDTYEIVNPTRGEVDLNKDYEIEKFLGKNQADYIVYAAGVTRQDQAEEEKDLALHLNATVPKVIAEIANKNSTPLIYFSTDAVFDGNKSECPYKEEDVVNPVNYYGLTKAYGEEAVLMKSDRNLVIRLISVYTGRYARKVDFARRALIKLSNNQSHEGITDLFFNPTYSDDAVNSLRCAIANKASGVFHIGSSDIISNYEFMILMAESFSINKKLIKAITFKDFFKNSKARRGQYTWLDTSKARRVFGENVVNTNVFNLDKFRREFTSR